MFSLRWVPMVLLGSTFVLAVYLTLLGSGVLGHPSLDVKATPEGHLEIAWLMPATSGSSWERFVAAALHLEKQWPKLYPNAPRLRTICENAFPNITAEVPELGLYVEGRSEKLWVRWYKLSSHLDPETWINKMAQRGVPPLAIIGGDTSDRALSVARILRDHQKSWRGAPPLFLLTTATADRYFPAEIREADLTLDTWPKLMDVYQGRSFRFSFTNSRMSRRVIDFVSTHPDVWSHDERDWGAFAGAAASGSPWATLGTLASKRYLNPVFLYTLAWRDDRYSWDLADRFSKVFAERYFEGREDLAQQNRDKNNIPYGVGDYFQPNPREAAAAAIFLLQNRQFSNQNQLLVLPAGTQRARRFLRTLCRMAPREMDNIVVVSGDSIDFNHVFRDRDLAWNILDMPVPLVFFCHRNPVDRTAGFAPYDEAPIDKNRHNASASSQSGTQDLLLYTDMLSAIIQAVFQKDRTITNADQFRDELRKMEWRAGESGSSVIAPRTSADDTEVHPKLVAEPNLLFDADGDRNEGTGEHIVWLKPIHSGGRTMTRAVISVWNYEEGKWREASVPLDVIYHSPVDPGNVIHGLE